VSQPSPEAAGHAAIRELAAGKTSAQDLELGVGVALQLQAKDTLHRQVSFEIEGGRSAEDRACVRQCEDLQEQQPRGGGDPGGGHRVLHLRLIVHTDANK
jgi:hypothetical protein